MTSTPPQSQQRTLSYERQDGYSVAPSRSALPAVALAFAILHMIWGILTARMTVTVHEVINGGQRPVLLMVAWQLPTGVVALVLGILVHTVKDGRRLAGPAMWIVGMTPIVSVVVQAAMLIDFLPVLLRYQQFGHYVLAAAGVMATNVAVLLLLRNRILKERETALPVLPIDNEDADA